MVMCKYKQFVLAVALMGLGLTACDSLEAASIELVNMKQVGFGNIEVPVNICNDEIKIKSIYFKVKEESDRMKKVKIDYAGKNKDLNDCIVTGRIGKYELVASWREPYADTKEKEVWSKERKWKNDKGKEKTMTITRYTHEPYGVPGGYNYTAHVSATLNLVSTKTGEVLASYSGYETAKTEMKAFEEIVEEFYKKVNKSVKESIKMYKG